MKKLATISIIFCALGASIFLPGLRAQNKKPFAPQFPASFPRVVQQAWHHRLAGRNSLADQSRRDLSAPPNLFKTLTGNLFSSFDKTENYLFKKQITQNKFNLKKPLNAEHALFGDVQMAWAQQYGSQFLPSDDAASDVAVDRDGNVYVTGYLTNQPFGTDYFTVKYDAAGNKLWEARYNGDGDDDDFATAIAVDIAGNVYVTGSSKTAANASDYVTIKYDANGATQWQARYDSPSAANKSYDAATALAIDDSGNVYVSGWSENDFATVKYNAAGVERWRARYPGSGSTEVSAMAVDQSGNVYLAGQNNDAFITVKYNSAGQKEWSEVYSEFTGSRGIATALAIDRHGEVYVTGMYEGLSYPQYLTIRFNREGAREWTAFYRGSESCNWNIATALALDDSGEVYVTGESGLFQEICEDGSCVTREDIDYATIKYNRAGAMQWSARYGPGEGCSHAAAVNIDRTGHVLITGYDRQDFVTLKYNRDGEPQWISSFNGEDGAEDVAAASSIDGTGNVYVIGWSMHHQDKEWATVKYNAAGVTQWVARENSPGNSFDFAKALALDPDGNVYIAGASQNALGQAQTSSAWTIINYNSTGATNWQRHGPSVKNFRNVAEKIAVDANGNVYIIASQYDLSRFHHRYGVLAKYDRDGMELWSVVFDSTDQEGYSRPTALVIDHRNNVYVTGSTHHADFTTIKYDASGKTLWQKYENVGPQSFNGAAAIACDDSGNVYVAGIADGDGVTIKYNAAGITQWTTRYHVMEAMTRVAGMSIEPVSRGGNIYWLAAIGYYTDYLTLKYNGAGERQWEARFSRPGNSFDQPAALAIDERENVYVTGEAGTIKYDRDGATIWTVATGATALNIDEAGNLYTAGIVRDLNHTHDAADFFTAKYNALGALEWSARYDGPGHSLDYPVAIGLDQAHNVYVTGHSRSHESQHWSYFTTIKYTQSAVAVNEQKPHIIGSYHLAQNFPNPFNPSTQIRYTLKQSGQVTLKIFDTFGREIATLVNEIKSAGEHRVQWVPDNLSGGVYFYRLRAGEFVETKKLILMK